MFLYEYYSRLTKKQSEAEKRRVIMKLRVVILFSLLGFLAVPLISFADVVVVVNKSNVIGEVSKAELKDIFTGKRRSGMLTVDMPIL
jgi:hypothetical protein